MSNLLLNVHLDRCREVRTKKAASSNQNSNETASNSGSTGSSAPVTISSSVGLRSTNIPFDVTTIQNALNRIQPNYGGPKTPLVPDGVCGQKTVKEIQNYQLLNFGWKGADGEINPDSAETKLCSNFSRMTDKTPAEMQADDKIVTAGRSSDTGNLMLVRILTNRAD